MIWLYKEGRGKKRYLLFFLPTSPPSTTPYMSDKSMNHTDLVGEKEDFCIIVNKKLCYYQTIEFHTKLCGQLKVYDLLHHQFMTTYIPNIKQSSIHTCLHTVHFQLQCKSSSQGRDVVAVHSQSEAVVQGTHMGKAQLRHTLGNVSFV